MTAVRRLYVYFLAFVALAMLEFGAANLLRVALEQAATGRVGEYLFVTGGDLFRRQVALFAAIVAIALPVWLLHWLVAERWVRPDDPETDAERLARTRRIALAATLGLLGMLPLGIAAWRLVAGLLGRLLGAADPIPLWGPLATLVVAGAVWLVHWRIARRDARRTPALADRNGWFRLVVYGAAAAGLFFFTTGVDRLAGLAVRLLVGSEAPVAVGAPPWPAILAGGIASVVAGGAVWVGHWGWATAVAEGATPEGGTERRSALRRFALDGILLVAIAVTLLRLTVPIEEGLRWILGAPLPGGIDRRAVATALLSAAVYGAVWLYHGRRARRDDALIAALGATPARLAELERLYRYLVAAVGLALWIAGTIFLVSTVASLLIAERYPILVGADPWRPAIAAAAALVLVGLLAWVPAWGATQRRIAAPGASERGSLVRRAYLAIAAGAGVLMLLGGLAPPAYALFSRLLGAADDPLDRLADASGWIVAGLFLAAYHGALVRADARASQREPQPSAAPALTPQRLDLALTAPAEANLLDGLAALRAALPPGYRLEIDDR